MFRVTLLLALAGLRIGYTHAQTTESIRYKITQPTAVGLTGNTYKLPADSLVRQGVAVARYDKRFSGTNRTDALAKSRSRP